VLRKQMSRKEKLYSAALRAMKLHISRGNDHTEFRMGWLQILYLGMLIEEKQGPQH
jgi:hypothetical protein